MTTSTEAEEHIPCYPAVPHRAIHSTHSKEETSISGNSRVESKEQTELTSEVEKDSEREQDDSCGWGGEGVEEWSKKEKSTHGHGQQRGDCGERAK